MSEEELIEHCRQKDRFAQKQLYELYAGSLYALCIRYSGDRETAKDILHDGFLRIFTSFDKFDYRGEGSLKAWLSRVMVNTALEYLRKNGKINQVLTLDEIPDIVDPESESDDLERIPQDVLMNFISELPSGYVLIRVVRRVPEGYYSLADARGYIQQELAARRAAE